MSVHTFPKYAAVSIGGFALLAAAILALQFPPEHSPLRVDNTAILAAEPMPRADRLPFTFPEVVEYFETSLGHVAKEQSSSHALFVGGRPDEQAYTINIAQIGSEIAVGFIVIDDYGMNLVREFFEAPFFFWPESEQFYVLLYLDDGSRWLQLPRFDVLFDYHSTPQAVVIRMIFSPGFSLNTEGRR